MCSLFLYMFHLSNIVLTFRCKNFNITCWVSNKCLFSLLEHLMWCTMDCSSSLPSVTGRPGFLGHHFARIKDTWNWVICDSRQRTDEYHTDTARLQHKNHHGWRNTKPRTKNYANIIILVLVLVVTSLQYSINDSMKASVCKSRLYILWNIQQIAARTVRV